MSELGVMITKKLENIVSFHKKTILNDDIINFLSTYFKHPRDNSIYFDRTCYKFVIDGVPDKEKVYTSVTRWIHKHFKEFDADEVIAKMMSSPKWKDSPYYGMSVEEIKKLWDDKGKLARVDGTNMHYYIELYYNYLMYKKVNQDKMKIWKSSSSSVPNEYSIDTMENLLSETCDLSLPLEYRYFHKYESDRLFKHKDCENWVPYRTEWLIYDEELKVLGYIDMVFKNVRDDTYIICDWKRCKEIKKTNRYQQSITECISHLPDTNYWQYTLQLNVYKLILERKYGLKVSGLYLMSFHPECSGYERYRVPFLNQELKELFDL